MDENHRHRARGTPPKTASYLPRYTRRTRRALCTMVYRNCNREAVAQLKKQKTEVYGMAGCNEHQASREQKQFMSVMYGMSHSLEINHRTEQHLQPDTTLSARMPNPSSLMRVCLVRQGVLMIPGGGSWDHLDPLPSSRRLLQDCLLLTSHSQQFATNRCQTGWHARTSRLSQPATRQYLAINSGTWNRGIALGTQRGLT